MWRHVLLVFASVFLANVLALVAQLPWWCQPFAVLGAAFDRVKVAVVWAANVFAQVCIHVASALHDLWERLVPALRQTLEDMGLAVWKSLPSWTIAFWETVRDAIYAAASYVPRGLSLLVVLAALVAAAAVGGYVYYRYRRAPAPGAAAPEPEPEAEVPRRRGGRRPDD
jgi:hypothetical protein